MTMSEYVASLSKLALHFGIDTESVKIELQEWQACYVLEALRVLEKQWRDTAAACNDEDLAADTIPSPRPTATPCNSAKTFLTKGRF